ncbi:CBY1-interacting BAR domain-containing protein 1 isoform X2 [Pectinophora gossypiella]|uniref:CBY1-interacting BAR domain-containing protein 1 isoform X2 n=1 Tax=Pectinophora gossypiella TaxID=13191 RepID=UPI00214E013A|nr:CBY1-interacting BAR domain-containing protein 1 isoform X2 [Pectinophora gossypiella]
MFRGDNSHSLSYEQQAKFIQDRITSVEKNFGELYAVFGTYTRKTARLRDMGDDVAKALKDYANNEIVNKSLSSGLENLSITLTAIEEYRNCEVQRLEAKVLGELCQYEAICKHTREELKHTMTVREKELARKKVLDKARERQPFNRQQVNFRRKLRSPEKPVNQGISARSSSLASLMNQHSPSKEDDDSMSIRRQRSPEKLGSIGRSSSLAALMNQSSSKDEDDSTETDNSEEDTSEETESR